MRAALATALVTICAVGSAMFLAGRLNGWERVEEVGAWLTLPLWIALGGLALAAFIGQPLASLLRLAQRSRDRRRR